MFRIIKSGLIVLVCVMLVGGVCGWAEKAAAQQKYPSRPVDIIIPMGPGGSTDLVARIAATYLHKKWNVPVNVLNKPGGMAVPASLEVYNSPPESYTLLADSNTSSSLLSIAVRELPFDVKQRSYLAIIGVTPMTLIVPSQAPHRGLKSLETEVKKDPGSFTWSSFGGSGTQDYAARQFFKAIGIDAAKTRPVMGTGAAQMVTLTAGNSVKMGVASPIASLPAISGGTVRAVAVTSKERWPTLPDVPTTAEEGYPSVNCMWWVGISGPPKMPPDIVEIWSKALREMLNDPESVASLKKIGVVPQYRNPNEAREFVLGEMEELAKLFPVK